MTDCPATDAHDVDWLTGAAMLARRAALQSVCHPAASGPFDESFFMYSEELDLCHRLRMADWRIRYIPTVQIVHYEGRSSEQVVASRHIRFNISKVGYYRKYFGRRWATLLRHYLLVEYRIQLCLEEIKLWLGHKPALRRERTSAYRQVLASRLQQLL